MSAPELSPRQTGVVREALNVAMGTAGAGLSELVSLFVVLSVPDVVVVKRAECAPLLPERGPDSLRLTAVRQTFHGDIEGDAVLIFDETTPGAVANLLGLDDSTTRPEQLDLILEMSKTIIGRCVTGLSTHLFAEAARLDAPTLLEEKAEEARTLELLAPPPLLGDDAVLVARIPFRFEEEPLRSYLTIRIAEASIPAVVRATDIVLAKLRKR